MKQWKYFGEIFKHLKNISPVKREILLTKFLLVVKKSHFVQWDILATPYLAVVST